MPELPEVETIRSQLAERLPGSTFRVVVLVLNDNAFGFIKWKQENMGFRSFGLDYTNPDFARFAEAHGAAGITVQKGDDLRDVLKKAFSLHKVTVVECPIDYSVNYETFSKEIEDLVCRA